MKITVFGNPDLEIDNLPIRLLPRLREAFPDTTFEMEDPNNLDLPEIAPGEEWIIMDAVAGIKEVVWLTVEDIATPTAHLTAHDYDLASYLLLAKKALGPLPIRILGIPMGMEEDKAMEGIVVLLKSMSLSDHKGRKYEVIPYDPAWIERFAAEEKVLRTIFSDRASAIEHIGSTSVPGLAGKPTIDILVLVDDIAIADELKEEMERAGYHALGEYVTEGARLFVRESNGVRDCNVHVFRKEHPHVGEMLHLCDYLRAHPNAVAEYGLLKSDLARKYPDDYGHYRKLKDEWMIGLKEKVRDFYTHQ